ncbi:MAG TPA: hypothetical protein VF384_00340 [Planctomycetota bacterium]
MQHHLSVLAVAALAATTLAQTNVLPTSAATTAGSTANVFPWGTSATAYPGMRIMCVYDSSHFTNAPVPVTTPILITSLKWRANDTASTWAGGTYTNATVRLATAAVDYLQTSTNWAANVGPDNTVVYTGPVTVAGGTGSGVGVPGPFVVSIPVVPPFFYDPNAGDLVVDTEHIPSAYSGGSLPGMDVHIPYVRAKRVFSSTLYPVANGVDLNCDVMQIDFLPAAPTSGTNTTLGHGCIRSNTSFYEYFPTPPSFDLTGAGLTLIPSGGGHYVVAQGGSFLPIGSVQAVPTALPLGDNAGLVQPLTVGSFVGPSGPWTSLSIISNGIVSQAAGNTTAGAPIPATMLAGPQTGFYSQTDLDPVGGTGTGTIWFEESASVISVTWDNVKSKNVTGSTNTFQFQLYPSGIVNIVWVSMTTQGANPIMVGYSPAGASLDPGDTDLSSLGAISLGADVLPLRLIGETRPITGTNWNVRLADIPASGVFGAEIFGFSDPNVPDLAIIGLPGCGLRATLDVMNVFLVTGATHTYGLTIPAMPVFIGMPLFTNGVVWQVPPMNPFGAITSNGIKGTIGDQ